MAIRRVFYLTMAKEEEAYFITKTKPKSTSVGDLEDAKDLFSFCAAGFEERTKLRLKDGETRRFVITVEKLDK